MVFGKKKKQEEEIEVPVPAPASEEHGAKPEEKKEEKKEEVKGAWALRSVPQSFEPAIVNLDTEEAFDDKAAMVEILNKLDYIIKALG